MAAADVELRSMDVSVLDAGKANNKNNFMARATRRVYIALGCSDKIIDIPRTPQSSVVAKFPVPKKQLKHHFIVIVLHVVGSIIGMDKFKNLGNYPICSHKDFEGLFWLIKF